jgi:hypothetical protein
MFGYILIMILSILVAVPAGLYTWSRIRPRSIRSDVEIAATPARIWEVLTDLDAYPEWNPFIVSSAGEVRVGATLTNELSNGGKVMTLKPKVLAAVPGQELRWLGHVVVTGIVDAEHYFRLEPLDGERTRLVHGETWTGMLVPLVGGALDVADRFAAMNTALKTRVEGMAR